MRTTAKVGECTLSIGGDMSVLKLADKLALVGLAPSPNILRASSLEMSALTMSSLTGNKLHHLVFDLLEVV